MHFCRALLWPYPKQAVLFLVKPDMAPPSARGDITGFRAFARQMGFGKAALYLYHWPKGLLRLSLAEGGPYQQ